MGPMHHHQAALAPGLNPTAELTVSSKPSTDVPLG